MVVTAPTVGPSTPVGSGTTVASLQATVAAVVLPAQTPVAAALTPTVPTTLPHTGGGYSDKQRELLLAALGMGGLFAMSLWLRKRRKS